VVVAINWGGYLHTSLEVSPGKPVTCVKSRVMQSGVNREGEKSAVWAKMTSSAGEAERRVALVKVTLVLGSC
jgi:hypothetical protein